ncbi:hypothetical protein CL618_02460 [archaeon]|nr:hypothetical protein [archaeon]|tara:strand:- start:2106 stop:2945 length:840 start_codon:yes stop_codon:yes gene_type:complete
MIDKDNILAKRILTFYINKRLKSSLKKHKIHKEFKDIQKLAKKITSKPKTPQIQATQFQTPQEYQPSIKLEPLPEPTLKQPSPELIHKKYPIITTSQFTLSTADVSDTYQLHEPKLTPIEKNILQEVRLSLKDLIQKNPYKITHHNFLEKRIKKLLKKNKLTVSEENIHKIKYYLIRDSVGYGKIESLICDNNIKTISISLQDPVLINHKIAGQLQTNIKFKTEQELNNLIRKIAKKAEQKVSKDTPILSTSINNIKIQATLGTELAEPKITISRIQNI